MAEIFNKSENFINRELSWLDLIYVVSMRRVIIKIRFLNGLNFLP